MNFFQKSKSLSTTSVTTPATNAGLFACGPHLANKAQLLKIPGSSPTTRVSPELADTVAAPQYLRLPQKAGPKKLLACLDTRANMVPKFLKTSKYVLHECGQVMKMFFGDIDLDTLSILTGGPPLSPQTTSSTSTSTSSISSACRNSKEILSTPQRVDLTFTSKLANTELASPLLYKKSRSQLADLEPFVPSKPQNPKVTFFEDTSDPLFRRSFPRSILKVPNQDVASFEPYKWQNVTFAGFSRLVQKTFTAVDEDSPSESALNSLLGSLYSVLENEVIFKVKENYVDYGSRFTAFRSSISSIHANLRGLANELECINDDHESGIKVTSRLESFHERLALANKRYHSVSSKLTAASEGAKKTQTQILSDFDECKRLCNLVHKHQAEVLGDRYLNTAFPHIKLFSKNTAFIRRFKPAAFTKSHVDQLCDSDFSLHRTKVLMKSLRSVSQRLQRQIILTAV